MRTVPGRQLQPGAPMEFELSATALQRSTTADRATAERPAAGAGTQLYEGAATVSTAPFRSVGKMNLWYTTNFSSQKTTLTTRNAKPTMAR